MKGERWGDWGCCIPSPGVFFVVKSKVCGGDVMGEGGVSLGASSSSDGFINYFDRR